MTIEQVKQIADDLGIQYNPKIGVDVLTKRIEEHCKTNNIDNPIVIEDITPIDITDAASIAKKLKGKKVKDFKGEDTVNATNAEQLVRVIISCNNPDKVQYESDIFYVGNSKWHTGRCVQFNIETHVPRVVLAAIEEKMYTQYIYKKDELGQESTLAKQAKEYTIEYLPNLSKEELDAIKQRQLVDNRKTIDD